jgi:hypothetical protein
MIEQIGLRLAYTAIGFGLGVLFVTEAKAVTVVMARPAVVIARPAPVARPAPAKAAPVTEPVRSAPIIVPAAPAARVKCEDRKDCK